MMCRKVKNGLVLQVVVFLFLFLSVGCGKNVEEEIPLTAAEAEESDKDQAGESSGEKISDEEISDEEIQNGDETVYVDVCGQVKVPGVYALKKESRVYEAVEKAGGFTEKASAVGLNQAAKVSDGQQIYVPSQEEAEKQDIVNSTENSDSTAGKTQGKVNLNTASKEELMTLSGIGEVKADAILRYRSEKGRFQSVEEVKSIEGIKEGVYQKIKDQITV